MLVKDDLLNLLAGVNLGINASKIDRQAINAAIARLEDRNPTPQPIGAAELLNGNWRLLYTTSEELLGIDRVPLYNLQAIYQCIRVASSAVYNIGEIRGLPNLGGLVSVSARFTPASDRRVDVKFQRFVAGLQTLVGYRNPDDWIAKIETTSRFLAIDLDLASRDRGGWLDVTYLDKTLRISRGNVGSVFVLTKV